VLHAEQKTLQWPCATRWECSQHSITASLNHVEKAMLAPLNSRPKLDYSRAFERCLSQWPPAYHDSFASSWRWKKNFRPGDDTRKIVPTRKRAIIIAQKSASWT
jgi:hypothetical protein